MRVMNNVVQWCCSGIRCSCRTLRSGFVCLALLLFCTPLQAQFNTEQLSQSTVRVVVKVRNQVVAVASGFVWQQPNQVVTTLHVMDPDPKTKVIVEYGDTRRLAKVKSVLPDADLVLLEVNRPVEQWRPLQYFEPGKPKYKSLVTALGFNKGALGMSTRELIKGYAKPEVLQQLLPNRAAKILAETDIPSVEQAVYYLDGSLLPGFSGAPVVNENGDLIGIGNGGLENGAAGVSWVIPAVNLSRLTTSPIQSLPASLSKSSALFSLDKSVASKHFISGIRYGSELIPRPVSIYKPVVKRKFWPVAMASELENNAWVNAGLSWNLPNFTHREVAFRQFNFVRVKTRSFGQLLDSSGQPESVTRLLILFQHFFDGYNIDYHNLMFDVYTDAWYGLNIVVPKNADLVPDEGVLSAQSPWMCQTCRFNIQYQVSQSPVLLASIADSSATDKTTHHTARHAANEAQTQRSVQFLQELADEHWDTLNRESDYDEFADFRTVDNYGAGRQIISAAFDNFNAPFVDYHELNYFAAAHNRDVWFEAQGIVSRFDQQFLQHMQDFRGTNCVLNDNTNSHAAQSEQVLLRTLSQEQALVCRDITRAFWVLASVHFTSFANRLY